MKKLTLYCLLILICATAICHYSCKKEAIPVISTLLVSEITENSAKSGGHITDDGGSAIISKGVVWSSSPSPTIEKYSGITMEGDGIGIFISSITNLIPGTTYYLRAYASNNAGVAYGKQISFVTDTVIVPVILPTVTTASATNITHNSATTGGAVTSQGSADATARGVCWGTSPDPDLTGNHSADGSGAGTFASNLTGLLPVTTYYVRAYATNSAGTAYGNQVSFTTTATPPTYPPGTVHCDPGNPTAIVEVTNPSTGRIWMDRNLGASQVATSSTDTSAYGDLYQWGRFADGHQCLTSATTTTLSSTDQPGHGDFIIGMLGPFDWRSPQNNNLWQGTGGINNPCPTGFRLPTNAELDAERLSWSSNNSAGAFASSLKLPLAGERNRFTGAIAFLGSRGKYWSSTVIGGGGYLDLEIVFAQMSFYSCANGISVRCIKD